MEKLDVTDIEVVDILARGQKAIAEKINTEVENSFVPGVDNLVYFGLVTALEKNQDQADWRRFFGIVEEFFRDPQYSLYPDIIKSHVLDTLCSAVASGDLKPHYLSYFSGPQARAHMMEWERVNNKNVVFTADRTLNHLDVAEYISGIHPRLLQESQDHNKVYWDKDSQTGALFGTLYGISEIQDEVDWKLLFQRIEETLTEKKYDEFAESVCTHVIEYLSNISICRENPLKEKYIKKNIGPKAKEYWVAWEQFNGGPSLF
jgi:hypothetical protein